MFELPFLIIEYRRVSSSLRTANMSVGDRKRSTRISDVAASTEIKTLVTVRLLRNFDGTAQSSECLGLLETDILRQQQR